MGTNIDRYSGDPVALFRERKRSKPTRPSVEARPGVLVEHLPTEFFGEVIGVGSGGIVQLKDFDGLRRSFPLSDSFAVDGTPVTLVAPTAVSRPTVSASGSLRAPEARARVAQQSRIFVEGTHDAELIEKVWGDDLREAATVVEVLEGVDHLEEVLAEFTPTRDRRAGVLVDHLVAGSKETRIAEQVHRRWPSTVLVLGHPFVDVWQAVKPARLGLSQWPAPPRSVEWKVGVCAELGWPHAEQADIAHAWKRILERVHTYRDLESALSGQVEHLIDFVTVGHH